MDVNFDVNSMLNVKAKMGFTIEVTVTGNDACLEDQIFVRTVDFERYNEIIDFIRSNNLDTRYAISMLKTKFGCDEIK